MSGPPNPPSPLTLEELVNGIYVNPVALMPQWMSVDADPFSGASSTTLDRLAHQLFNGPLQIPHNLPGWLVGLAPPGQLVGFLGYIPAVGQQAVVRLLPHLARFVPREQSILLLHFSHPRDILHTYHFFILNTPVRICVDSEISNSYKGGGAQYLGPSDLLQHQSLGQPQVFSNPPPGPVSHHGSHLQVPQALDAAQSHHSSAPEAEDIELANSPDAAVTEAVDTSPNNIQDLGDDDLRYQGSSESSDDFDHSEYEEEDEDEDTPLSRIVCCPINKSRERSVDIEDGCQEDFQMSEVEDNYEQGNLLPSIEEDGYEEESQPIVQVSADDDSCKGEDTASAQSIYGISDESEDEERVSARPQTGGKLPRKGRSGKTLPGGKPPFGCGMKVDPLSEHSSSESDDSDSDEEPLRQGADNTVERSGGKYPRMFSGEGVPGYNQEVNRPSADSSPDYSDSEDEDAKPSHGREGQHTRGKASRKTLPASQEAATQTSANDDNAELRQILDVAEVTSYMRTRRGRAVVDVDEMMAAQRLLIEQFERKNQQQSHQSTTSSSKTRRTEKQSGLGSQLQAPNFRQQRTPALQHLRSRKRSSSEAANDESESDSTPRQQRSKRPRNNTSLASPNSSLIAQRATSSVPPNPTSDFNDLYDVSDRENERRRNARSARVRQEARGGGNARSAARLEQEAREARSQGAKTVPTADWYRAVMRGQTQSQPTQQPVVDAPAVNDEVENEGVVQKKKAAPKKQKAPAKKKSLKQSSRTKKGSYSDAEYKALHQLLKDRRGLERQQSLSPLRDVPFWTLMSQGMNKYGFDRSVNSCRMFWNRFGRAWSGFEERVNPTGSLVTSAQGPKKAKRTKALATKQEGDEEEEEEEEKQEEDDGEDEDDEDEN